MHDKTKQPEEAKANLTQVRLIKGLKQVVRKTGSEQEVILNMCGPLALVMAVRELLAALQLLLL